MLSSAVTLSLLNQWLCYSLTTHHVTEEAVHVTEMDLLEEFFVSCCASHTDSAALLCQLNVTKQM